MAGPLSGRAGTFHGKVAEAMTPGGESGVAPGGRGAVVLSGWTGAERAAGMCERTAALCALRDRAALCVRAEVESSLELRICHDTQHEGSS